MIEAILLRVNFNEIYVLNLIIYIYDTINNYDIIKVFLFQIKYLLPISQHSYRTIKIKSNLEKLLTNS
jgi:hypothetical protein